LIEPTRARKPRTAKPKVQEQDPAAQASAKADGALFFIALPWPDSALSPNSRNRYKKAAAAAAARAYTYAEARNAGAEPKGLPKGNLLIGLNFFPPDKKHRDLDNMVSMCKNQIDGLFQAFDTNDRWIVAILARRGQVLPGGLVELSIFLDGANLACFGLLPVIE
jgi:crossover junction endodeoxyribonuclease RusA